MQSLHIQWIMKINASSTAEKTNPNKPCPACPELVEGSAVEWANLKALTLNSGGYTIL